MRIIETKVWTINEHPDKQAVLNWVRNNWHDLADTVIDDVIDSLIGIANELGTTVKFSISAYTDRNEYIKFGDYDKERLKDITEWTWSDKVVIDALQKEDMSKILQQVHKEAERVYSDEGLTDFLSVNGYNFILEGKCVNY